MSRIIVLKLLPRPTDDRMHHFKIEIPIEKSECERYLSIEMTLLTFHESYNGLIDFKAQE